MQNQQVARSAGRLVNWEEIAGCTALIAVAAAAAASQLGGEGEMPSQSTNVIN